MRKAQAVMQAAIERLPSLGLTEDEIRRVFENELAQARPGLKGTKNDDRLHH